MHPSENPSPRMSRVSSLSPRACRWAPSGAPAESSRRPPTPRRPSRRLPSGGPVGRCRAADVVCGPAASSAGVPSSSSATRPKVTADSKTSPHLIVDIVLHEIDRVDPVIGAHEAAGVSEIFMDDLDDLSRDLPSRPCRRRSFRLSRLPRAQHVDPCTVAEIDLPAQNGPRHGCVPHPCR